MLGGRKRHQYRNGYYRSGFLEAAFALPAVLIASLVMISVMLVAVQSVVALRSILNNQVYQGLAEEAAESGTVMALACLRQNAQTVTWSDQKPLRPNTNCNGDVLSGASASVLSTSQFTTTFSVPNPNTQAGVGVQVEARGETQLLRRSTNQIWKVYSISRFTSSNLVTSPQLGGGAGWRDEGHIGFFVSGDGKLYAWGDNRTQVIGPGSLGAAVSQPVFVEPPPGETTVAKVASSGQGATIICAIFASGNAYCRGVPGSTEWVRFNINTSLKVTDIVVNGFGRDSICVVASDANAYCAGENERGGLGVGDAVFRPITNPRRVLVPPSTAKKVFTQDYRTCVITTDNAAHCSGANDHGQLGNGTRTSTMSPVRANVPGSIVDIKTTYHSHAEVTYFLTSTGALYGAGSNKYGTMNDSGSANNSYPTPRLLRSGVGSIISVGSEGSIHFFTLCALDTAPAANTSGVWCMGGNNFGQVRSPCGGRHATWQQIQLGGARVDAAATQSAGYQMNSVMVITTDGRVFSWGDNKFGKLGTGQPLTTCNPPQPQVMQLPQGTVVTAISNVDEYSSSVLTTNAIIYSAGRNDFGQLGTGDMVNSSTPRAVPIDRTEYYY